MEIGSAVRVRRKIRTSAALCTAIVLLGACHPRHDTHSTSLLPGIDPCELVTRADAEQLLGVRVKPAERRKTVLMATGRQCRYTAAPTASSTEAVQSIELTVYDNATIRAYDPMFKNAGDYFRRDMNALRHSGTRLVPMPGLGEEAYWQPGPDLLHVLDRGVYLMLEVNILATPPSVGATTGQQQEAATQAAEINLARDTILPRLRPSSFISTHHEPLAGTGEHSS